jgi:hypothetical protein
MRMPGISSNWPDGQLPEAAIIPKARLGLLAGFKPGQSKLDQPLAKALNHLHDLCLLEGLENDTSSARLHPLVRDFSFNLIPEDERDSFRRAAAYHLKDAYFDYPRLEGEIQTRGANQVIDDLQIGVDWWGMDEEPKQDLEVFLDALRLSSHVLIHDPAQLPGQLIGRLIAQESQGIRSLLAQARATERGPFLYPYSASMIPAGGALIRTLTGHAGKVFAVSVTPDGRQAVSGAEDKTLKVWDLETGRELRSLKGHAGPVLTVSVTPDGRRAVSGSFEDATLKLWDLETGRVLRSLKGHAGPFSAVSVMPDGRRAISASYSNGTLKVWDLETGRVLKSLDCHDFGVSALAVTLDGRLAVSASGETLKVWDLETGRELRTLKGHTGRVGGVAVTPDGLRAVSGSKDNTLKVWDLETGEEMATFSEDSEIIAVALGPDGKTLVAADEAGRIHFLKLEGFNQ